MAKLEVCNGKILIGRKKLFGQSVHTNGTKLYSARIIPFKGSWIEFATDINNVMYAYIDRKKKLPVTTLLRAIGFENDKDILQIFDLAEDVKVNKENLQSYVGKKLAAGGVNTFVNITFHLEDNVERTVYFSDAKSQVYVSWVEENVLNIRNADEYADRSVALEVGKEIYDGIQGR